MSMILCAVDLSASRGQVSAVAAALAHAMHARLELLHVAHVSPGLPADLISEDLIGELRESALVALRERASELAAEGLEVGASVRFGLVDDEITARARELGAELLVLGTHARKGAARFFMGSVAERMVRHAACPTVVVPIGHETELGRGERPPRPLRVTAGIDASPSSDAALAWLRTLAARTACDVRLVHVFWPPREHERLGLEPPLPFDVDEEAVAILTRELASHVATHFGQTDVPLRVRPTWAAEDDPLVWEAETDDADLLVVGISPARRSTAVATVRAAHLPVVCVPRLAATVAAAPRLAPVRQVLVTTDFSPAGDAAVAHAYRLLARGGGAVVLVHVAEPGRHGVALDEDRRDEIETCLLGLVPPGVDAHAIASRTFVVADASPGAAIVKAIRRFDPDVVVMASHGHGGLRRAVHGSVTEHVVRTSPKPVLVVPPPRD